MENGTTNYNNKKEKDLYLVNHKDPADDGPYFRAKHAQDWTLLRLKEPAHQLAHSRRPESCYELVEKDSESAIIWFWNAINMGDRVESALKDTDIVMKQLDRTEETIEAVKSFRGLCPRRAQESLNNVLIDLYKGILGWAYMQKSNYMTAKVVYRKAQLIDPDTNEALNLCHCLVKQARYNEAYWVLQDVLQYRLPGSDDSKSRNRARSCC